MKLILRDCSRIRKGLTDVVFFQVRMLGDDLRRSQSIGYEVDDVRDRDPQTAQRRPSGLLLDSTERLDRWAAHPLWGILILSGILGIIFWLTFVIGTPIQNWLNASVITVLANTASASLAGAPAWLSSLIVNGVLGCVGSVLGFLPIMLIFFATMGILEDIGYMARQA